MPKPISSRKLAANRRNALHATGPRSPEGKDKVSRNALRHGILAAKFLVTGGDGREDRQAYEDLRRRLHAELQPVGILQELDVKQLGEELWRLHERVNRAEQGEIRKRTDALVSAELTRRQDQFSLDKDFDSPNLRRTSLGLQYLIDRLEAAIKEATAFDYASNSDGPTVGLPSCIGPDLAHLEEALTSRSPEQRKPFVLDTLRALRARLTRERQGAQKREQAELDAKKSRLIMPDVKPMEKILRYKTATERSIDRLRARLPSPQSASGGVDGAKLRLVPIDRSNPSPSGAA